MGTQKKLKKLWRKMKKNEHIKDCQDKTCEICKEIRHVVNQDAPFHVSTVILNPTGDLILLGKRNSDGIWTSAGGHAYKGESPKQAALRELFEETGFTVHPENLIELPSLTTYSGKPAHAFMAFSPTHQEPITTNDPDRELKEWKWFGITDNLPEPMDENRTRTVINAKMKLKGLIKSQTLKSLEKAIVLNENIPGVDLNTSEYSLDAMASKDNPLLGMLESSFSGMVFADVPIEVDMGENSICLSIVDYGIYSGWVKNNKTRDVMLRLEKMPIPSIVQAIEAKQLYKRPDAPAPIPPKEVGPQNPEVKQEQEQTPADPISPIKLEDHMPKEESKEEAKPSESSDLGQLLDALKYSQAKKIHIHIHKSLKDLSKRLSS